ncbi:hypothetical protein OFO29_33850, partial [Escherichia coli]|nr:hypothetical protein [Escherichia coli]
RNHHKTFCHSVTPKNVTPIQELTYVSLLYEFRQYQLVKLQLNDYDSLCDAIYHARSNWHDLRSIRDVGAHSRFGYVMWYHDL